MARSIDNTEFIDPDLEMQLQEEEFRRRERLDFLQGAEAAAKEIFQKIETAGKSGLARMHREELAMFRAKILNPLFNSCADTDCKNAKTVIDCIKYCQECERKTFDFDKAETVTTFNPMDIQFEMD